MGTKRTQSTSFIRFPLDYILNSEKHVRVLRRLADGTPQTQSELARKTGLSTQSVVRALDSLFESGVVEKSGVERRWQYRFREDHPLAGAIRALFSEEARREESLWDGIREKIEALEPTPQSAWAEGPVATGDDTPASMLRVCVLADSGDAAAYRRELGESLSEVERRHDVMIDLSITTVADLQAAPREAGEEIKLITGIPPDAFTRVIPPRRAPTHADFDDAQLAKGRALATLVRGNPALVQRAADALRKQIQGTAGSGSTDLVEWLRILTTNSPARIANLLEDPGERATRLRQTPVLTRVLTRAEMDELELLQATGART